MNDHRADDQFCELLCREYEADPERGQFVTLEAAALACGVVLGAIEQDEADEKGE